MTDIGRLKALLTKIAAIHLWRDTYPDGPDVISNNSALTLTLTPADVREARRWVRASAPAEPESAEPAHPPSDQPASQSSRAKP